MNGPHPRGSIRPKSGWTLMKRRKIMTVRQDAFLSVTNVEGTIASHRMTEDDCIELATALLQHVANVRFARKSR